MQLYLGSVIGSVEVLLLSSSAASLYNLVLPSCTTNLHVNVTNSVGATVISTVSPEIDFSASDPIDFINGKLADNGFFTNTFATQSISFEIYAQDLSCSSIALPTLWSNLIAQLNDTSQSAGSIFSTSEAVSALAIHSGQCISDDFAHTIISTLYDALLRASPGFLTNDLYKFLNIGVGAIMNSNPSNSVSDAARFLLNQLARWGGGQSVFTFSSTDTSTSFLNVTASNTSIQNVRASLQQPLSISSEGFGLRLPQSALAKVAGSFASVRLLRYEDPYLTSIGSLQTQINEFVLDSSSLPNFKLCNRFPGADTYGGCFTEGSETTLTNLQDPIVMNMTLKESVDSAQFDQLKCEYYDTTSGNFSTKGCSIDVAPLEEGQQYVTCSCNHATAFAVSLTIQEEAATCADLNSWKPVYQTNGYKAWVAMLLSLWGLILVFLLSWLVAALGKTKRKLNITFFTNFMLILASSTRVLFFSLLLDAWNKTDNIACVEFGYNDPNLPVPPKDMNVIYDLFFPLAFTGFSAIFLFWYDLARVLGRDLAKVKDMRFVSQTNLWVSQCVY
jgi:hypothetical protein